MASIELDSFYLEVAEELPARSRDKLIAVIVRKIAFDEEPESLPAALKAVYKALKPTIERSITNSKNGKKGGRPKTETETQTAKNSEKPETETETQSIKKAQKHETEMETQTAKNEVNTETEIKTQEEKNTVYIDSKELRNTKNTEYYSDSKDTEKQEIESNNNIKNTIDTVNTRNRESIENNNIKSYITPYSPPLSGENKTETETESKKNREKPKTEIKTQITEIADRVVDYLNLKAGTSYRHGIAKTISLVSARLKDGFTENDFTLVINKKCEEWNKTDYAKYLRPETLFGTKFESYLNQIPQQNRIDSRSITSPQKNTVPREKRLPWVPDAVYDLPDFGYITSDVYPYDGIIEYIDCNNNYASWEAPNKETAQKIDADYKAYAAEKERQRKERSETQ